MLTVVCVHDSAATTNEGYAAATTANEGYVAVTRVCKRVARYTYVHASKGGRMAFSFRVPHHWMGDRGITLKTKMDSTGEM